MNEKIHTTVLYFYIILPKYLPWHRIMTQGQPHTVQVFEHQTIRVGDQINNVLFDEATYQALAKYQEKQQTKYFSLVYKGIKFSHYVGVLQVGKVTIEILPKADKVTNGDAAKWQAVLLEMLRYCRLIKVESLGVGKVRLQSNTVLDIYFEQFLDSIQHLLEKGLPKQYLTKESNQKALKGRLVLPKQLRKNSLHPERFYVKHTAFAYDHLFNQVLQEAVKVLQQVHLNPLLKLKLQQVLAIFPKLAPYQVSRRDFDQLFQSQKYRPHHELLEMSRLILLNFSPDIRSGQHHLFALLFDMNKLFEAYVFWKLKTLENEEIKVQRQVSKPFWQRRTIRPDILLTICGKRYVLDTKWKILNTNAPSIEDLKQLYIYCQYFEAEQGILLYPSVKELKNSKTIPFQNIPTHKLTYKGQIIFLNILNNHHQLNKNIGKEFLDLLDSK